jgi:hypothetical protein
MATYTVTDNRLVCTGSDITSDGIKAAIDSNPSVGVAQKIEGVNNSSPMFQFKAEITIGDNGTTTSTWKVTDEYVHVTGQFFIVNGANAKLQCGQLDSRNKAQNTSCFTYSWSDGTSTNDDFDKFQLNNGGGLYVYGGYFKVTSRNASKGRIKRSPTSPVYMQDAELEIEDAINTTGASTATYSFIGCRIHHTSAVGLKLDNVNTSNISNTKIEGCKYAIQPGPTPVVLKDLEINANNYHLVPNVGNCNITFVNPDFTVLRVHLHNASDTTTLAYRYDFKVQDSSLSSLQDAKVYIADEEGDIVVDGELTDSNGLVNSHLFNYDGDFCLQNGTFAGGNRTARASHTRLVFKYGFILKSDTLNINQDTKDFVALITDANITEQNKSVVDAYTEITSPAKFYDRASAFLQDNLGTYSANVVSRDGNTIDAGSYDVVVDGNVTNSASAFTISGNTLTIKATTFVGNISTSGSTTLSNDAKVIGTFKDTTVLPWEVKNVEATSRIQLYNLTKNALVITQKLSGTAGTYVDATGTYDQAEIAEGDVIRLRCTCVVGAEAMLPVEITGVATSTGITFSVDQQADEIYNSNGIDGSQVSTLSADYSVPQMGVDIDDGDSTASVKDIYAFFVYSTTTKDGVENWFGGIRAIDNANYEVKVANADIKLQNISATSSVVVTDGRMYRDDGESILYAENGDKPIVMDSGALVTSVQPQVEAGLNANAKISSINNNSKLIPSLL